MELNKKNKNFSIHIDKSFEFFTYLFSFLIPFGIYLSNIIILWGIFWLLWIVKEKFNTQLKLNQKQKFFYFFILIFFIFHIIGVFYSENLKDAFKNISIKTYIILIPFILIIGSGILNKRIKSILNFFVAGNIVSSTFLLIRAFAKSISFIDGKFIFQASINPNYSFFESISFYGNHFFYSPFSYFIHPSYASVLILISIIILIFQNKIYSENLTFLDKLFSSKKILLFSLSFLTFIVLLFSSKANFFALLVLYGLVFMLSKIRYKYVFLLGLFVLTAAFVSRNGRFNVYLKNLTEENTGKAVKSGMDRFYIWEKCSEIIKENFWTGVGTGDVNEELSKKLTESNFKNLNNAHNEFIESFFRLGLIGFALFVLIFFYGFWFAYKENNIILVFFLIVTAINFFFESMLNRVMGTIFFGFFVGIIPFIKYVENFTIVEKKLSVNINALLFTIIFVYSILIYRRGLFLDIYNTDISEGNFLLKDFSFIKILNINIILRFLWSLILNVPNLFWHRILDALLLSGSFVIFFKTIVIVYNENKYYLLLLLLFLFFIISLTNLLYINSLIWLSGMLFIYFLVKCFKMQRQINKRSLILKTFLFLLVFIKILTESNLNQLNYFSRNKYIFMTNGLVASKKIQSIGIVDYEDKIKSFDEFILYVSKMELNEKKYYTNINILPYLIDVQNCQNTANTEQDEKYYCLMSKLSKDYFHNYEKEIFFENNNFIVYKEKN